VTHRQKAAMLIRVLGWLALLPATFIAVAAVAEFSTGTLENPVALALFFLFFAGLGLFYFTVSSGIRQGKEWGRMLGFVISAFSLLAFPIGTLLGGFILYYLVTGWNEDGAAG